MKSAFYDQYGPPEVLSVREIPIPKPKPKELLIKIIASTVTSGDHRIRGFICPKFAWIPMRLMLGISGPRNHYPGMMYSGEVVEVGSKVKDFKVGDEVFGSSGMKMGAFAEYISVSKNSNVVLKPQNISHESAAPLPFGANTSEFFLNRMKVSPKSSILIYGASGAVGTYAIQLSKILGAAVTGVCSSKNMSLVKSLGADVVIDYSNDSLSNYQGQFDFVFDAVGLLDSKSIQQLLKPNGVFKTVGGMEVVKETKESFVRLASLCSEGKLQTIIDSEYPLTAIVEANKRVSSGRKVGNVILKMV